MFNSPEQMIAINKATLDMFQAVALKSYEGFEKLAELNLQAIKTSMSEASDQARTLMALKDPKAFAELAAHGAQPATEKAVAYAKHVYEITSETGTEISRLFEKQIADGNKQLSDAIDAAAKNAPAGSEGIVTFVKSAMSSANTAFDQVNRATKQAVELAESNIAAAVKKTGAAKKAA